MQEYNVEAPNILFEPQVIVDETVCYDLWDWNHNKFAYDMQNRKTLEET